MEAVAARSARLTWLAVILAATLTVSLLRVGADARWLAAMGRAVVHTGSIPSRIPYAVAPSSHWTNVPVLGELSFYGLESAFGDRGLVLFQLIAVVAALALLGIDMRRARTSDPARALVLVLVLFAAAPAFIVVRSQVFSLVLFPLLLLLLRAERRAPSRRIWLLVPLVALWSNLHGAVLVGLLVAAVYLLVDRVRLQPVVSVIVLASCLGALFMTPALLRTPAYYRGVLESEAARRGFGLWAPLSPHSVFDVVFVLVAVPLVMLALRQRPPMWELVALALLAGATVHANRNSVWFAFLIGTPAARGLTARVRRDIPVRRPIWNVCLAGAAVMLLGAAVHTPVAVGAGPRLLSRTAALADGRPVLADELDAEQLALDGQHVWIANPMDAFASVEQRAYLDWLEGRAGGDRLLRAQTPVVLVTVGTPAQKRLARDRAYRAVARDRDSILYLRRSN